MFYNVPLFYLNQSVSHIFQKIYGFTFANSTNNTTVISIVNIQNSNIAKVHRHH